jgi:N-acetylglucosamine kinase-like BadF-type ATPase
VRLGLAIDGGNSKTDAALVREDGALLRLVRGDGSSPHHLGAEAALDRIGGLVDQLAPPSRPAEALLLLAGADFPDEEEALEELAGRRGWADRARVRNDTFAVLRAGTDRGWGVAVVCGAGINALGVARDGRTARFPALGATTGDWGGGDDLGLEALFAAARSEDGRGPRTLLERAVPEHFGLATPAEVAHDIHRGRLSQRRLIELAPVVFALSADDAAAAAVVARLVGEVVAFVRVAASRLGLEREELDVVLGGGVLQHAEPALVDAIAAGVRETVPRAAVRTTAAPAILGSALLVLDDFGSGPDAKDRLRRELQRRTEPVKIRGTDG